MRVLCPHCGKPLEPLPFPLSTVDAILETAPGQVLLVRRRFPPLGWALPGGFVERGERLEEACRREVAEETGLSIDTLRQLHTYSDPSRDPRHHTITTVFATRVTGVPKAGSDAADLATFPLDALPDSICFDHRTILEDYRSGRWGIAPSRP